MLGRHHQRGAFHSYDAYTRLRFASPSSNPAGIIVALDQNGTWAGMTPTTSAIAMNHTLDYVDTTSAQAQAQAQAQP
ncbi:hypothetical protein ACFYYB_35675 [Streptomyces sp. NPDC002886]|uniref:hypothetical protein n=1 Tax=Streptomyces sp. NPDC002886 TaxID=3364667 RepID=UPI00367EFE29